MNVPSLCALFVLFFAAQPDAPPTKPDAPTGESAADVDRIDAILTALEKRGDNLSDIRCKVHYVEQDKLNLSTRTMDGQFLWRTTDGSPSILIRFDKTNVDGVSKKRRWYLLDGEWFYVAIERIAKVTKRQLARPGEKLDFFDIEKAPFPMPFGQKKGKILKTFDVTLLPPAAGDPPNTDHLVCVPKSESEAKRNYKKVEFFVLRDLHLPRRIVVTKSRFEINTADFTDLSAQFINVGLTKKDFAQPREWKDYQWEVEKLDDEAPPSAP